MTELAHKTQSTKFRVWQRPRPERPGQPERKGMAIFSTSHFPSVERIVSHYQREWPEFEYGVETEVTTVKTKGVQWGAV